LFDFDGVIADTEPRYADFFRAELSGTGMDVEEFVRSVRGTPLKRMMEIWFKDWDEARRQALVERQVDFELHGMRYDYVPGARELLDSLKARGIAMALVTSSHKRKMAVALKVMGLEGFFDTVVTAEDITRGKPDPMCYLLAAERLGARREECIIFEDSLAGLTAARRAGIRGIGLSTSHSPEELAGYADEVIPDFTDTERVEGFLQGRG